MYANECFADVDVDCTEREAETSGWKANMRSVDA